MAAEQSEFATEPTPVFTETVPQASTQESRTISSGPASARPTGTGGADSTTITPNKASHKSNITSHKSVSNARASAQVLPNTMPEEDDDDFDTSPFFLNELFESGEQSSPEASSEGSHDPFTAAMLAAADEILPQVAILHNLETGERIELTSLPFTIGSAPSNDLVVPGAGVAAHQARIENQFQRYVIQDLARQGANDSDADEFLGVKVNGYRIENVPLEAGDEITLGGETFEFQPGVLAADAQSTQASSNPSQASGVSKYGFQMIMGFLRRQWMVLVPLSILSYAGYVLYDSMMSEPQLNSAEFGRKPAQRGLAANQIGATEFVITPNNASKSASTKSAEGNELLLDKGMNGKALADIQFSVAGKHTSDGKSLASDEFEGLDEKLASLNLDVASPKPSGALTQNVPGVPQLEKSRIAQAIPPVPASGTDQRSPLTQPAKEGQDSARTRFEGTIQAITEQISLPDVSGPLKNGSAPPQGSFDYGQIFNVGGKRAAVAPSAPSSTNSDANSIFSQLNQSADSSRSGGTYQRQGPSSIDVIAGQSGGRTAKPYSQGNAINALMGSGNNVRPNRNSHASDLGWGNAGSSGSGMPPQPVGESNSNSVAATLGEDWAVVMGERVQNTAATTPPPPAFDEPNKTPPMRLSANSENFPEFPENEWDQPLEEEGVDSQQEETLPQERSLQEQSLSAATAFSTDQRITQDKEVPQTDSSASPFVNINVKDSKVNSRQGWVPLESSTSMPEQKPRSPLSALQDSHVNGERMTITLSVPTPPRTEQLQPTAPMVLGPVASEPSLEEPEYLDQRSDPFMELIEERLSSLENGNNAANSVTNSPDTPQRQLMSSNALVTPTPQDMLDQHAQAVSNLQHAQPSRNMAQSAQSQPEAQTENTAKPRRKVQKDTDTNVEQATSEERSVAALENQARDLILGAENTYKENGAITLLRDLRHLEQASISSRLQGQLTEQIERYAELYSLYSSGKKAFESGNKEKAFERWIVFLNKERDVVDEGHSLYAKKVRSIVSKEYAERAGEAEKSKRWADAWRNWQSAKKFGKSDLADRKMAEIEQQAQAIFDQGIDVESADPIRARNLWQEVMRMLPKSHELYARAAAKVSWYEQWRY